MLSADFPICFTGIFLETKIFAQYLPSPRNIKILKIGDGYVMAAKYLQTECIILTHILRTYRFALKGKNTQSEC